VAVLVGQRSKRINLGVALKSEALELLAVAAEAMLGTPSLLVQMQKIAKMMKVLGELGISCCCFALVVHLCKNSLQLLPDCVISITSIVALRCRLPVTPPHYELLSITSKSTGALNFKAWEILRMDERAGRAVQEESRHDC
jgi:hypothetical protein